MYVWLWCDNEKQEKSFPRPMSKSITALRYLFSFTQWRCINDWTFCQEHSWTLFNSIKNREQSAKTCEIVWICSKEPPLAKYQSLIYTNVKRPFRIRHNWCFAFFGKPFSTINTHYASLVGWKWRQFCVMEMKIKQNRAPRSTQK